MPTHTIATEKIRLHHSYHHNMQPFYCYQKKKRGKQMSQTPLELEFMSRTPINQDETNTL